MALITGVSDYGTYCPGLVCQGGSYYALCNGTGWFSCSCGIPSGDNDIAWSGYGAGVDSVDGGNEASGDDTSASEDAADTGSGNDASEGGFASEDAAEGGFSSVARGITSRREFTYSLTR